MTAPRRDLSHLLAPFPRERQWTIPALQVVQRELASLPLWALAAVGEHLRVPASELYGVATHYPELRLEPIGVHRVRVCTGLSCRTLGAAALLEQLGAALGLQSGQTAIDGAVTLDESHCAFICGVAPVVEVDGVWRAGLLPESVPSLVGELALKSASP